VAIPVCLYPREQARDIRDIRDIFSRYFFAIAGARVFRRFFISRHALFPLTIIGVCYSFLAAAHLPLRQDMPSKRGIIVSYDIVDLDQDALDFVDGGSLASDVGYYAGYYSRKVCEALSDIAPYLTAQ
jgi:hypothetical protein